MSPRALGSDVMRGDTESQVARLLLDADRAMKTEDWEIASAKCDDALKLDPAQELARDKRQRAEAERKNRTTYANFLAAADKEDVDAAMTNYGEVAEDSVYRQKGAERYAHVKKEYLRLHIEAARKAREQGHCEEARQHVEAALTVDESNIDAQDVLKTCGTAPKLAIKQAVATVSKRASEKNTVTASVAPSSRNKETSKPAPDDSAAEPPPPNPVADKLVQEAQDAYVHGQYANAIDLARKAAKLQPAKAYRLIGAASCCLKDRSGALQAWNKLGPQERSFLRYVCQRNQIAIP
jgi:hypothetical protein